MRVISETISFLILLGVLTVAFISTLVVVPKYFLLYNEVAEQASSSIHLQGYSTSATLTRCETGSSYTLYVLIHNSGEKPVRVNYVVVCEDDEITVRVGEKEGIILQPGEVYGDVIRVENKELIESKLCFLIVEEPNILIYKVLES